MDPLTPSPDEMVCPEEESYTNINWFSFVLFEDEI